MAKLAPLGASLRLQFLTLFVVSRAVNVLKGKVHTTGAQATPSWDDDSVFDKKKDKDDFRQYDEACDHVKEFYREQHGTHPSKTPNYFLSQLTCYLLSPSPCVWIGDEQRSKPSRTIFAFARNSKELSEPAWVSGRLWRSLASSLTIQIPM